jgi:hypothetical protein
MHSDLTVLTYKEMNPRFDFEKTGTSTADINFVIHHQVFPF